MAGWDAPRGGGGLALAPVFLGAAAVVVEEEDEGILELGGGLKGLDDAADATIHGEDHRGVDLHAAGLPFFVGLLVPVADERGGIPCGIDQAELDEPLEARLADGGRSPRRRCL